MQLERDIFKFLGLAVTAVVIGNVIVNYRGPVALVNAGGSATVGILKALTR